MSVALPVRFGDLTLDGKKDAQGDRFIVSDIDGYDAAETELSREDLMGDGVLVTGSRLMGREITVKGWMVGNEGEANSYLRARQKLKAAAAKMQGTLGTIYFDEPTPGTAKQCQAQRIGRLWMPAPKGDHANEFEVTFLVPDSRLYSQSTQTTEISNGASATLVNYGTEETAVIATLMDATVTPSLRRQATGTDQTLRLSNSSTAIPAGTVVDFARKRVDEPGAANVSRVVYPDYAWWWKLKPGSNLVTAQGRWSITWRSAY